MTKFIFKCKTSEAYNIKILSELLSSNIRTGCFDVTKEGISLRMFDFHRKTLIDFNLNADKFSYYRYNSNEPKITMGLNLNHFFKMLKTIKKKDSLELHIEKDLPNELMITTIPRENNRKTKSGIKIQSKQNLDIEVPTGYSNSILIPSCELQKMYKDLNSIGSLSINVYSKKSYIEFCCNTDDILKRTVCFGEEEDEDDEEDEEDDEVYNSNFSMDHFFRLHKITGLCNNTQIYASSNDLPLYFKTNIGTIGNINVYIKSKEMIEREKSIYE